MSIENHHPAQTLADHLFREHSGRWVSSLTRRLGLEHLDLVEDAVQEAFIAALKNWPFQGTPDQPGAWILRVAQNRALDVLRRKGTWNTKSKVVQQELLDLQKTPLILSATFAAELNDDQVRMLFACCHPSNAVESQVALTLKIIGGLSVAEIARAFLARETTIAQRLVRAKRRLRRGGIPLQVPPPQLLPQRLEPVLEVLYLLFNEGYSALEGEDLVRHDLCHEALRLGSLLAEHPVAGTPTVHALVSLFCFQSSRLETRVDETGEILLLSAQDRQRWDRDRLAQGLEHLAKAAAGSRLSRYHLEAEIASCHALAPDFASTNWQRILECYGHLQSIHPSPVVAVNRAIALSYAESPEVGLKALEALGGESRLMDYGPFHGARGELLVRCGRPDEATAHFQRALALTASQPTRRYLLTKLKR